jgi:hypothetical protein
VTVLAGSLARVQALARWRYEVGLAAVLLLAAAILWDTAGDQSFARDEWQMILDRDLSLDGLLRPHNDQVAVLPAILWHTLIPVLGLGAYEPYLALHIAANVACGVLVFVYVRRRLGPSAGIAAAAVLVLLGPAWETIAWPFMGAFIASAAFGVAALLALDRENRRGDLMAAGFVLLSIASSNVGLPFAVAAAAQVIAARTDWWRRLLRVLAVPVALYAIWRLAYRDDIATYHDELPPKPRTLHLIEETPRFAFDLFAFGVGAVSGLSAGFRFALAAAAILAIVIRLLRPRPLAPAAWAALAFAATYAAGIAYSRYGVAGPETSRYAYVTGVAVLLLAATFLPRPAPGRRIAAVILALAGLAVLSNLTDLRRGDQIRNESVSVRAALLGVELARDRVDAAYHPPLLPENRIPAGPYLDAVDDHGSPAYTPAELRGLPDSVHQVTDRVLVEALEVGFQPVAVERPPAVPPCVRVALAGRTASTEVEGRDGLIVHGGDRQVELRARRFAEEYPAEPSAILAGRQRGRLGLPPDRSEQPWRLRLTSGAPFVVC